MTRRGADSASGDIASGTRDLETREPAETRILVVGDWFVDDHWVAAPYRSSTSSRTGRRHLASLQGMDSETESLCGAGRTAAVLFHAGFPITGVGVCAQADQRVLLTLLASQPGVHRNPHTMRRWSEDEPPEEIEFCNLGTQNCGTHRAIRIYEKEGPRTILTERFDWETPIPQQLPLEKLEALLEKRKEEIDAVVVKDLAKKLVRPELVSLLADRLGSKAWFVSTKVWLPAWLPTLKRVNLRLYVVPEMAARAAIGARLDQKEDIDRRLTSWMVTGHQPSKGAFAMFENKILPILPETRAGQAPAGAVIVPNEETVLALAADGSGSVYSHSDSPSSIPMPLSSVLLGALTGRLLKYPTAPLCQAMRDAAAFTQRWREFERGRVTRYWSWTVEREPPDPLSIDRRAEARAAVFDWRTAHEDWQAAYPPGGQSGIIDAEDGPRLELWRAMTELPGYICVVRKKREAVARLVQMATGFRDGDHAQQASAMIIASPGSGKTQLVKCLARLVGFPVLAFDVSQLYRVAQLLDCFDRISTTQAQQGNRPLLVFFDEIDSRLEGDPVYRSFLAPLEEGVYLRAEKLFHLRPAIWLFAGTDLSGSKAPDFRSRLTEPVVELTTSDEGPEDYARVERQYLGAALLKGAFREVEFISEAVLDLFARLSPDCSVRKMSKFAASFRNVRERRILPVNIPWEWAEINLPGLRKSWVDHWGEPDRLRESPREVRVVEESD